MPRNPRRWQAAVPHMPSRAGHTTTVILRIISSTPSIPVQLKADYLRDSIDFYIELREFRLRIDVPPATGREIIHKTAVVRRLVWRGLAEAALAAGALRGQPTASTRLQI